ncbi:hypothetical protein M1145_01545 [Patescibacteria group bacterium]|nr:hypothetical protein [Patescibacteria group bacterium]
MEKEQRRYTKEEIREHRKNVILATFGIAAIATFGSFLPNNTSPRTGITYQKATKVSEGTEEFIQSNIEPGNINWTKNQRKYGAFLMVASGNKRYAEMIFPENSPINTANSSNVVVNFENRFGYPINPSHSTTTIGKYEGNTTISVEYPETARNFKRTTSRILNEPTTVSLTNGQTFYFGINPNS